MKKDRRQGHQEGRWGGTARQTAGSGSFQRSPEKQLRQGSHPCSTALSKRLLNGLTAFPCQTGTCLAGGGPSATRDTCCPPRALPFASLLASPQRLAQARPPASSANVCEQHWIKALSPKLPASSQGLSGRLQTTSASRAAVCDSSCFVLSLESVTTPTLFLL